MKLFHLVAVKQNPHEIREEVVPLEEYEAVFTSLSRRYETIILLRTFNGVPQERHSTKG